ncbi:MAG: 4-alpha-glucanotransferase [Segetibacter sp.]
MSEINLFDEEDLSPSTDDVLNDGGADNSRKDNSLTPGGKSAGKKSSKETVESVKAAKTSVLKADKEPAKKGTPKKASLKRVETIEPKPAKVKKAAAVKKQPDTEKQPELLKPAKAIKKASPSKELKSAKLAASTIETEIPAQQQKPGEEAGTAERATVAAEDVNSAKPEVETKTSAISKITFQIKYSTVPGESLLVTANHPLLGNNDPEKAFPLSYLNEDYWFGTIEIPNEHRLTFDISYNYIVKNIDGSNLIEWGTDKIIKYNAFDNDELLLIDTWNPSSSIENTFFTEPFTEVLLKENFTEVPATTPSKVTHIFRAKAPLLAKGQALCILGSVPELGSWNTEKPLLLSRQMGDVWHSISLDLSNADFPFNYKYGVFDINTNAFIAYETGPNRPLYEGASDKLTVVSDGFAAVSNNGFKGAGVAIPVFGLRTNNSFGVGEFPDLKLLVNWAKQVGLKLVQLLPVNDTTATHTFTDSYPYAAISAFALHPLYLHLPSIVNKENESLLAALKDVQADLNSKSEVDYVEVMRVKWDLIKQIFPSQKELTFSSPDFNAFFKENEHWLIPYAAFSYFREQNKTTDLNKWQTNQKFDAQQINELAGSPLKASDEASIYYYIQFHLHLQLKDAANYAHQNGIIVKGDIPIGIYRNSCDAWQQPELFHMDMQAGAPPDDFALKGQNWGFPTYNWQRMREDGFTWWKKRFTQMSYYFDAFRIDHILGFFRIWSIPMDALQGIMGHFVPAVPVHINEISERGIQFDYERLCTPFINEAVLNQFFNGDIQTVISQFLDSSKEGYYKLKPSFDTQREVENYFAGQEDSEQNRLYKEGLFNLISNVIFFEAEALNQQEFHFRIAMADTLSYQHLDGNTKHHLYELYVNYFFRRQDNYWEREALMKLPELKRSTNMLICGEDLGMVPACVPGVMKELAILSLEIQRMPKDPTREFFHPNDAPYLSVVTPSTHDMSTIRGWWAEDRAATQRFFNNELGQWGTAPYFCEPWINRIILLQHLYSPAMWSIFQLQDLLGMSAALRRENPNEERINIPADSKHYWRYRMHISLEQLLNEKEFTDDFHSQVLKSGR